MDQNEPTKISIIIVTWNSKNDVIRCIDSILKYETNIEIIVVDNDSSDGTVKALYEYNNLGVVKVFALKKNLGFSKANDFGYRNATGSKILFLNPDTYFIEKGLDELSNRLDNEIGMIGCKLLNEDRTLQPSIFKFDSPFNIMMEQFQLGKLLPEFLKRKLSPNYSKHNKIMNVDWLVGAFLLLSKEDCDAIGGFSTDYFMYAEDMDIAYKIHNIGKKVVFNPCYSIVHVGGSSEKQDVNSTKKQKMFQSRKKFSDKYGFNNMNVFYFAYVLKYIIFSFLGMFGEKFKTKSKNYKKTLSIINKTMEKSV